MSTIPDGVRHLLYHHGGVASPIPWIPEVMHDEEGNVCIVLILDGFFKSEESAAEVLPLWIADHERAVAELAASPWADMGA